MLNSLADFYDEEIETNLGMALVESEVGGAGGGHTVLSPEGRRLVEAYRRFQARLGSALESAFEEELGAAFAEAALATHSSAP